MTMSDYNQQTGDGKWLKSSLAILHEEIKRTEADSTAEPQKYMRSVEGADSAELRFANCQR
jgi:hypothetical protein